ncbi:hypothetical protein M3J09_009831 [Ascochyta lentis]
MRGAWDHTLIVEGISFIRIPQDCCLIKAGALPGAGKEHWKG